MMSSLMRTVYRQHTTFCAQAAIAVPAYHTRRPVCTGLHLASDMCRSCVHIGRAMPNVAYSSIRWQVTLPVAWL
jgi:hypothetical protein